MKRLFSKVIYTEHLNLRIELRSIPNKLPKQIYLESKERYFDKVTGHYIAVMVKKFRNKTREFVLSYDEKDGVVELITIHPIKTLQKLARVNKGRWQKL